MVTHLRAMVYAALPVMWNHLVFCHPATDEGARLNPSLSQTGRPLDLHSRERQKDELTFGAGYIGCQDLDGVHYPNNEWLQYVVEVRLKDRHKTPYEVINYNDDERSMRFTGV